MRIVVALLFLCLAQALPAVAQERFSIGALHAGMSVQEAISALPNAQWNLARATESRAVVGATAPRALTFLEQLWDVAIGDLHFYGAREAYFDLTLTREQTDLRREACYAEFSQTVAALEPRVGAFGRHEGFEDPRSRLYMNPYGPGMRLEDVAMRSRMRFWRDGEWEPAYTFREADEALPYVVEVALEFVQPERACTIKIKVFANDPLRARFVASSAAPPVGLPSYTPAEEAAALTRLALPASHAPESVLEKRYELQRWSDTEFARFGARAEFPGFEGYFAVAGDRRNPGGVVRGRWRPQSPDALVGEYVEPHSVCGAPVMLGVIAEGELVYLGTQWLPEFAALDAALGGPESARDLEGRSLPATIEPLAWQSPPTASAVSRFYPSRAMQRSLEGVVTLSCRVEASLNLRCAVTAEEPSGTALPTPLSGCFKPPAYAWRRR